MMPSLGLLEAPLPQSGRGMKQRRGPTQAAVTELEGQRVMGAHMGVGLAHISLLPARRLREIRFARSAASLSPAAIARRKAS